MKIHRCYGHGKIYRTIVKSMFRSVFDDLFNRPFADTTASGDGEFTDRCGSTVAIALSIFKAELPARFAFVVAFDSLGKGFDAKVLGGLNKGEHHLMQTLRGEMNATDEGDVELEKVGGRLC